MTIMLIIACVTVSATGVNALIVRAEIRRDPQIRDMDVSPRERDRMIATQLRQRGGPNPH